MSDGDRLQPDWKDPLVSDLENGPLERGAAEDDDYYEEMTVEYVDNGRRRATLAIVLAVLVLLLAGFGYVAAKLIRPTSGPTAAELPKGISWVRSIYSWGPSTADTVVSPTAAAISSDGTIWTLAQKRYIVGFSPSGQVRRVIAPEQGGAPGQVSSLEGLSIGDDGSIYVADFGNNVIDVYSPAGVLLRSWGVQLPTAVDVKGNKVAVAAANGIGLFDTQGTLIAKWGSRGKGDGQVDLPHGIVIGTDGNIYVSDSQNRRVVAYSQSGKLLWMRADPRLTSKSLGSTNVKVPKVDGVDQGLILPAGITQDSAGRLVLVDPFSFQIVVLDPKRKGQIVARYGEDGPEDGRFAYPTGIAYDAARDWFVIADTTNDRLQIIRIPGTGGSVAGRTIKSLTDTPIWVCSIPLLMLLLSVFLLARGRRHEEPADAHEAESQLAD